MNALWIAVRSYFVLTVVVGVIYPAIVTLVGQTFFSKQANGSLVRVNGQVIGSELIAQKFETDRYFWPRPSATDFSALPSGGSNLGLTSSVLKDVVFARRAKFGNDAPASLVFSSASGLDPDIDLAGALYQVPRIAKARGVSADAIKRVIWIYRIKRQIQFLGEERVNVLNINLMLDKLRY